MLASRAVRRIAAICSLTIAVVYPSYAEPLSDPAAVGKKIAEASQRTMTRLATDSATWTTSIELAQANAIVKVKWIQSPSGRLFSVAAEAGGETEELVRILERDGAWYVKELGRSFKTRPYEAVLGLPTIYHFLNQSDLRLFSDLTDASQLGTFESEDDGCAIFRSPLPAEQQTQLQAILPALQRAKEAEEADVEALQRQEDVLKQVLERGVSLAINLEHGYLAASGFPGQRRMVGEFKWLPALGDDFFQVKQADWEDQSLPLAADAANRGDLVMLGHCPAWRRGEPAKDTDAALVNINSGAVSRIPYNQGVCQAGCFSRDRSKAYVSGVVADEGKAAIFEIDLLTGENRRLTGADARGLPLFLTLSPDGSTLACVEAAPGTNSASDADSLSEFLKSRILLVDVKTGAIKPVGKPLDTASLAWLPSGNALLLITREYAEPNKPSRESLAVMSLDGSLKTLRRGSSPQLVRGGTAIFYQDEDQERWYTCDLNGENPQVVGDGLPSFGFPAASPAGDRLVMMRFGGDAGPRPHVIDVQTGEATPIPVGEGLWTMPAWK